MKPEKFDIGDWVVDDKMFVRELTSDDMPDLPYESIVRYADEAEIEMAKGYLRNKDMSKFNFELMASEWSCKAHDDTNHLYDGRHYGHHLAMVVTCARKFIHLIPEKDQQTVLAACWAHDTIEDARQTYNDVKTTLGKDVAEIVYAVTNEKGKNRKERANSKYYEGIRNTPGASFVKLCDRIANMEYSKSTGSSMYDKYKKEMGDFVNSVFFDKSLSPLLDHLLEI